MSDTTTRNLRGRKCGECAHYWAMVYQETGTDACCGRCMLPGNRTRRVRQASKAACGEFFSKGGAPDHGNHHNGEEKTP